VLQRLRTKYFVNLWVAQRARREDTHSDSYVQTSVSPMRFIP
jgi:hypothetical protein